MVTANPETLSERDFRRVSEVVYRHCGINLHDGKKELVHARIAKRLRLCGCDSASAYLDRVLANPDSEEFTHLIDSLSTNLTSFFREMDHFDFLLDTFLPDLLRKKREQGSSRIRGWSAGCSTGEEAYSLAMTLLHAAADQTGWDMKLLATDISTRTLDVARRGVYEQSRVKSVPPFLKSRYLRTAHLKGKAAFQVAPAVRNMVQFAYLNLIEPWPFTGPFDFIFCRNVMIYFDKPTQQSLVNRFWNYLEPDGVLFTGHSESLTGVKHRFRYVRPTIYAKD